MRNPALLPKKRTDCFLRRMPIYNKKRDAPDVPPYCSVMRSLRKTRFPVSAAAPRKYFTFSAHRRISPERGGISVPRSFIISPLTRSICICTRGSPCRAGGKRARYPARPRLCTADSYILSLREPHRAGEDGVFRPSRRSL